MTAIVARERHENRRETTLQTPRSVKEGEKVLQAPEQRFPAAHSEDHGEAGCAPAAHGG